MRHIAGLILVLAFAPPVLAQDEDYPYGDPPDAAEESAPEAEPELIPVGADEPEEVALPEETGEPEEPSEPIPVYAGVDTVGSTLAVSSLPGFAAEDLDSGMYRLRLGIKPIEKIAFEFHYGLDDSDSKSTSAATDDYYGLFLVPQGRVLDTVDLSFPIGFAKSSMSQPGASADLESVAYGMNAELPFRVFSEAMPDLRITAGWMIYYQKGDARLYGGNFGVRYDFTTTGFGFGAIGDAVSGVFGWIGGIDLWPFGDDEGGEATE